MLSLLLLAHACLPLYVYAPCVKACELEQLTELYKCRIWEVRKICSMQYVKAGQNVHHEMVRAADSEKQQWHRALSISVTCTGKFTGFICNTHSREESSFLFWLHCWIITVKLLSDLNIKLTLLASMNFNIFSSLNCLCYYSNWRCLSLRHLFSCLWNAINVIIHLLHSLEIMTLRMSLLLSIQAAYKPKPCFQRHFLSIILRASQNETEDSSVVWALHASDFPTVTMRKSYWQNGHLPCPCCTSMDVLFCRTIQAKIN